MYISPKLCLTPEIKLKGFRIGECVGIGQTTVLPMHYLFGTHNRMSHVCRVVLAVSVNLSQILDIVTKTELFRILLLVVILMCNNASRSVP